MVAAAAVAVAVVAVAVVAAAVVAVAAVARLEEDFDEEGRAVHFGVHRAFYL